MAIATLGSSISQTVLAQTLPSPDANGDFTRRTTHTYWEVVDPDPNGLNCRMVLR